MKKITHIRELCDYCGTCVAVCPHDAIELLEFDLNITDRCTVCQKCVDICPISALEVLHEEKV